MTWVNAFLEIRGSNKKAYFQQSCTRRSIEKLVKITSSKIVVTLNIQIFCVPLGMLLWRWLMKADFPVYISSFSRTVLANFQGMITKKRTLMNFQKIISFKELHHSTEKSFPKRVCGSGKRFSHTHGSWLFVPPILQPCCDFFLLL